MKWLMILVLAILAGGSWVVFAKKGADIKDIRSQIAVCDYAGDPDGKISGLESQANALENERIFSGVLLTFLSAGVVGILFVVFLLPFFAQRITHAVYDSAELMEKDVMHDARSLLAQGDYPGAIEAFQKAAAAEPLNRLPWVEIAKIQRDQFGDSGAAIQTIRHALENHDWELNDAAYFLFRLAEMYHDDAGDRASAVAIMNQVINQFPGTRHAANATHKLHEWSSEGFAAPQVAKAAPGSAAAQLAAEEEEYLAQIRAAEHSQDALAGR